MIIVSDILFVILDIRPGSIAVDNNLINNIPHKTQHEQMSCLYDKISHLIPNDNGSHSKQKAITFILP